jgi:hypothetical protein
MSIGVLLAIGAAGALIWWAVIAIPGVAAILGSIGAAVVIVLLLASSDRRKG